MRSVEYNEAFEIDITPFNALVGEEIVAFLFEHAPGKVLTRVTCALDHYIRSESLYGIDEEMGAIRLVAAEEELVVAIFEWIKLHANSFPEHRDFVGKFKNHVVKLAFYPVLQQFRFLVEDMLRHGFTLDGLEGLVNWTAKPVVEERRIKLAICRETGEELMRISPFSFEISKGDIHGQDVVPLLLKEFASTIRGQHAATLREFLVVRADFRNRMLYATDAGSARLGDRLADLRELFGQTLHDLLWVLTLMVGGEPPSKQWGIISQFIGLYRLALIEAKILKVDNTIADPSDSAGAN